MRVWLYMTPELTLILQGKGHEMKLKARERANKWILS